MDENVNGAIGTGEPTSLTPPRRPPQHSSKNRTSKATRLRRLTHRDSNLNSDSHELFLRSLSASVLLQYEAYLSAVFGLGEGLKLDNLDQGTRHRLVSYAAFIHVKIDEYVKLGVEKVLYEQQQPPTLEKLLIVATTVATFLKAVPRMSIDGCIKHLVQINLLSGLCTDNLNLESTKARQLIFSVIGWICMLYNPKVSTNEPDWSIEEEGSTCFVYTRQPITLANRPMAEILSGFGTLLPNNETHFQDMAPFRVSSLNAATLQKTCNIRIRWVLSISAHLDFDQYTRTLYLFCMPSFAAAMLESETMKGASYSLFDALYENITNSSSLDLRKFYQELLRSYQLLFRDDQRARAHYRSFQRQHAFLCLGSNGDEFLDILCGMKHLEKSISTNPVKDIFTPEADFPIFAARLQILQDYVQIQPSNRMKAVWHDRRDMKDWYTFWAVMAFGSVGVLIGICQLVLQAVQTAWTIKAYNLSVRQA